MHQDDVKRLAALSRLRLSPEELERYTAQLDVIFHHVDQLKQVDVSAVAPLSHILPMTNVIRSDDPAPSLQPEDLATFAPAMEHHQFVIPKILEGES